MYILILGSVPEGLIANHEPSDNSTLTPSIEAPFPGAVVPLRLRNQQRENPADRRESRQPVCPVKDS